MLLGISPSPPWSITCAPPIRTLFKSVPSRLTHHLLISVPPRAPPLAALKLRRRGPLIGFFSPQQQESLSTQRQIASLFSSLLRIGDSSFLRSGDEEGKRKGIFFPLPMQNVLQRLHLGVCHVVYFFAPEIGYSVQAVLFIRVEQFTPLSRVGHWAICSHLTPLTSSSGPLWGE